MGEHAVTSPDQPSVERRDLAHRSSALHRGIRLEAFTISWNVVEALIALGAGYLAGSVALVGFGLDSVIETIAALALYRRLRAEAMEGSEAEIETQERRALRIVGVTFFLLGAYILYEAGTTLWLAEAPEKTAVGIALAAVSLVVMPILGWAKLRTGRALGSRALVADAKETFVCSYLSLTLLLGLGLYAVCGWWWADPIAGLAMVPFIIREGWEAIEEVNGASE
jgi:divalent metal cation (Fe/Co/Zn/Cd) transporter